MKEKHFLQQTGAVTLLTLLCCFLWGSAFPCIKIGYTLFSITAEDTASQIVFGGVRFTLAGLLVILIYSAAQKKPLMPQKHSWGMIGVIALFQTILQYVFFYVGLAHTTGVKGSIIEGTNVFLALLIASLLFHQEHLTKGKILGCIIGFAGVILVNVTDPSQLGGGFAFKGEGFLLIACVAYSVSSVLIKIFAQKENPVTISGYQFLIGGMVMTVIGLAMGGELHPSGGTALALLIYLAFLSAVAYSVWGVLLKFNPVSKVCIFGFSTPVFGVVLSAVLLGEGASMPWIQSIAALILVSAGIYLVNKE